MTVVIVYLFSFSKKERQKKAHEPLLVGLVEFMFLFSVRRGCRGS